MAKLPVLGVPPSLASQWWLPVIAAGARVSRLSEALEPRIDELLSSKPSGSTLLKNLSAEISLRGASVIVEIVYRAGELLMLVGPGTSGDLIAPFCRVMLASGLSLRGGKLDHDGLFVGPTGEENPLQLMSEIGFVQDETPLQSPQLERCAIVRRDRAVIHLRCGEGIDIASGNRNAYVAFQTQREVFQSARNKRDQLAKEIAALLISRGMIQIGPSSLQQAVRPP